MRAHKKQLHNTFPISNKTQVFLIFCGLSRTINQFPFNLWAKAEEILIHTRISGKTSKNLIKFRCEMPKQNKKEKHFHNRFFIAHFLSNNLARSRWNECFNLTENKFVSLNNSNKYYDRNANFYYCCISLLEVIKLMQ